MEIVLFPFITGSNKIVKHIIITRRNASYLNFITSLHYCKVEKHSFSQLSSKSILTGWSTAPSPQWNRFDSNDSYTHFYVRSHISVGLDVCQSFVSTFTSRLNNSPASQPFIWFICQHQNEYDTSALIFARFASIFLFVLLSLDDLVWVYTPNSFVHKHLSITWLFPKAGNQ